MTVQVEAIHTPDKDIQMNSTSEKGSRNRISNKGSTIVSSLKFLKDILAKKVIEKRDNVFRKVAKNIREVANGMDALCIHKKEERAVSFVAIKDKNENNNQSCVNEMKPYAIAEHAEHDENAGSSDRDQTNERLDDPWTLEIKLLVTHKGLTWEETLFVITLPDEPKRKMKMALTTYPVEDGTPRAYQFQSDKGEKNETYEYEDKKEYEKDTGIDTECENGTTTSEIEVAVNHAAQKPSGSGSSSDDAKLEIPRHIVNGKTKMDVVGQSWGEAKDCIRELTREQATLTKPKSQKGYDREVLKRNTYCRNEGEMEQGGCDNGIEKSEDEYKDSALGKDNPQKEEHGPNRKTARAVKGSKPRRLDDTRNMARSRDDNYQNQQVEDDGIISSMPLQKELPDTVTHGRSSEIPNLHYKNVALRSSEKKTNLNATKQAKRASKKRSRRKRPRSPSCCSREGCCYSRLREADNLTSEPTLLKKMPPEEKDRCFRLLETSISRLRQSYSQLDTLMSTLRQCISQLGVRQSCKPAFARKRRQTGDDVQRCELSAAILLDHAGDSQETITTKDEILYKIGHNVNNPKALYNLASEYLPKWKDFRLEQLTTAATPDQAAKKVITEFKHQGLKIGHLVNYFNDDFTCRADILCLIGEIHPNCVYCCPEGSCK